MCAARSIFQSVELEQRFWDVLSGWEEASTKLHGVPVLGVGRGRVFHSLSVKSMRHKWCACHLPRRSPVPAALSITSLPAACRRENLTEEDLDVYKSIGAAMQHLCGCTVQPRATAGELGGGVCVCVCVGAQRAHSVSAALFWQAFELRGWGSSG